jgi:hypothetical protein
MKPEPEPGPEQKPGPDPNPHGQTSKNGDSPGDEIPETIDTLESLRFDPSKLKKAAKKLLTTVPVRKPNRQEFIRVHPAESHRLPAALIEIKEDREIFLVQNSFIPELGQEDYTVNTLFLAMNRSRVPFLWPVKVPGQDGRANQWHVSAQAAALAATTQWIKVASNMHLGAYEVFEATCQVGEPEWPEISFQEIVLIAFRNRIIRDHEHPALRKLWGDLL